MCGLIALITRKDNGFTADEGMMYEQSMIFNQMRGDDSTGTVCIDKNDAFSFIKSIGGYRSLTRHARWNDLRRNIMNEGRLVFGHGRAATRGIINGENAHPFHIINHEANSEIVFMHNGTLDGYQSLPGLHTYSVDSAFLGSMIAQHGAEKALSEISGAMACLWWDAKDSTFNFFRNKDRPLHYMGLGNGAFYLNSEKWVLEYLNWKFKLGVADKHIYMIKENELHKVPVNGKESFKFDIKTIKSSFKPVVVYGSRKAYDNDFYAEYAYGSREIYHNDPVESYIFVEDKDFWDRDIDCIEWTRDGRKIISYRDRRTTTTFNQTPPEPGLMRMYELKLSGDIMKVFQGPADANPRYVTYTYKEWNKTREPMLLAADSVTNNKDKTQKPIEVKFSTRSPSDKKVKIKHKGIILNGRKSPHLEYYSNTADGEVRIGDEVKVEVLYVEEKELKNGGTHPSFIMKVVCAAIKEKQDTYIDFVFYTSEYTKRQIEDIRFFKGTIGSIVLADSEQQKLSGAYAVCAMNNVKSIAEIPANEVSVEAATTTQSIH